MHKFELCRFQNKNRDIKCCRSLITENIPDKLYLEQIFSVICLVMQLISHGIHISGLTRLECGTFKSSSSTLTQYPSPLLGLCYTRVWSVGGWSRYRGWSEPDVDDNKGATLAWTRVVTGVFQTTHDCIQEEQRDLNVDVYYIKLESWHLACW